MSTPTTAPYSPNDHADHHRPSTKRRAAAGIAGLAAVAVLGTFGVGHVTASVLADAPASSSGSTATVADPWSYGGQGGTNGGTGGAYGGGGYGGNDGTDRSQTGTTSDATPATAAQKVGLVYITTTLDYGSGEAAGTGMVLTSDGEVLTNHHVVEGATAIEVEIASTGATYEAEVVGYDAATDVALLKLENASGLKTVTTDTEEAVEVGDDVVGVGNAGGTSEASAAAGDVTGTNQAITVSDESGGSEHLTNLIEIDADIMSGDSGGPLYDDDGEVVGMNTAASSGSTDVTGFAIPIATALSIVDQIISGDESGNVQIGATAFLGVTLANTAAATVPGQQWGSNGGYGTWGEPGTDGTGEGSGDTTSGVAVAGTVDGSAAADAGIVAGDTITAIGGTEVTSADGLSAAIAKHDAGDRVTVTWTDVDGASHSAKVTLGEGPVG